MWLMKNFLEVSRMHYDSETWGFFLGGGNEGFFATWPISSHVGVQIGREMMRLITLIDLKNFLANITEKIFKHDISMVHRQKTFIFDVLKAFISNFTYYKLY